MNRNLRRRSDSRPATDGRAHVSDLIVAYFIRGIRSLDATPRGAALHSRAWSARPPLAGGRRGHPWS